MSDDSSDDFVTVWDASIGEYVRRQKVQATLNLSPVAEATHSQSVHLDTGDVRSRSPSEPHESDLDIDSQSSDLDDWRESAETRLNALLRVASRRPLPPARGPMIPANRDQSQLGNQTQSHDGRESEAQAQAGAALAAYWKNAYTSSGMHPVTLLKSKAKAKSSSSTGPLPPTAVPATPPLETRSASEGSPQSGSPTSSGLVLSPDDY